jgi:hypothetical protein
LLDEPEDGRSEAKDGVGGSAGGGDGGGGCIAGAMDVQEVWLGTAAQISASVAHSQAGLQSGDSKQFSSLTPHSRSRETFQALQVLGRVHLNDSAMSCGTFGPVSQDACYSHSAVESCASIFQDDGCRREHWDVVLYVL